MPIHFQVATEAEIGETNAEVTQWRRREATKRLKRLLQLDPQNERALFNLGMLAMDNGDMPAAEHNFKVRYPLIIFKKTLFSKLCPIPFFSFSGIGSSKTKFPIGSF